MEVPEHRQRRGAGWEAGPGLEVRKELHDEEERGDAPEDDGSPGPEVFHVRER